MVLAAKSAGRCGLTQRWSALTSVLVGAVLVGTMVSVEAAQRSGPPGEPTAAQSQVGADAVGAVPAPTSAAAATTQANPPTPGANRVSGPPEDPRLAQVYAIFETSCAQCHQTGRLTRPAAAGSLANILDLEELAREPHLLRPGLPDASKLFQVLIDRHRPVELGSAANWPDVDGIQRVRTWIAEVPSRQAPQCPSITDAELARAIDGAATTVGESEAHELRFVSLAHLANACATASEMEGYRQGVAKLLNSLSWGSRPIVPDAIGPSNALVVFKLSDLGWVDEHWTALARSEPKSIARDLTTLVAANGANGRPIRGDWMAWVASQPPFYAELLGIPTTAEQTAHLLGIKLDEDSASLKDSRGAIRSSAITRGPRVIENHHAESRAVWKTYDFFDAAGDRDVFERPLGGVKGAPDQAKFRADGQRLMFTLPNGFLAYALQSADGHRIDQLPTRLDFEAARVIGTSAAGLACIGCHAGGPKIFPEAMRGHLASDKFTGSRETKEQAQAIYQSDNDLGRLIDDDAFRYRRALIQAGIDPDLLIHGHEPVSALARRYILDVDFANLGAEAGLNPAQLELALSNLELPDTTLVPRLRQGVLNRTNANTVLAALKSVANGPSQGGLAGMPPPSDSGLMLALWTDRARYKTGDLVTIFAQPTSACHLTLISVNATGKATVLYPNEFDPDNLIAADSPVRVPSPAAQYQFRFADKGIETVSATCQTVAPYPPGIEPDYEHQRFTSLGSYDNFLRASFIQDTDGQRAARLVAERTRVVSKSAPKDPKPEPTKSDGRQEKTARAALRVEIE